MYQMSLAYFSIQARFEDFDRKHPEVCRRLVRLAFELKERGFKRCGMKFLFERLRWFYWVERGDADFKLNNDFHSRYARKIMAEFPELQGFFEVRELKAA
jgi:hypothetical protein